MTARRGAGLGCGNGTASGLDPLDLAYEQNA
jgi:hypothetical protein